MSDRSTPSWLPAWASVLAWQSASLVATRNNSGPPALIRSISMSPSAHGRADVNRVEERLVQGAGGCGYSYNMLIPYPFFLWPSIADYVFLRTRVEVELVLSRRKRTLRRPCPATWHRRVHYPFLQSTSPQRHQAAVPHILTLENLHT